MLQQPESQLLINAGQPHNLCEMTRSPVHYPTVAADCQGFFFFLPRNRCCRTATPPANVQSELDVSPGPVSVSGQYHQSAKRKRPRPPIDTRGDRSPLCDEPFPHNLPGMAARDSDPRSNRESCCPGAAAFPASFPLAGEAPPCLRKSTPPECESTPDPRTDRLLGRTGPAPNSRWTGTSRGRTDPDM